MKFNIILENGLFLPNCTVYSNFGEARSRINLENALRKERQITIYNHNTVKQVLTDDEIYEIEDSQDGE